MISDQQNPVLTALPFVSFVLLAFYGVKKRTYLLPDFIPLVLSATIIVISYYLIAVAAERSERQRQLELAATTDYLTGLYNRRYMEQRIQLEFERYRQTGAEFALIIADIDLFKEINDHYGHACGDNLLKSVAGDLKKSVREQEAVARWGGDEFVLILPAADMKTAAGLAERLRAMVEKRGYVFENQALTVTLTLGVSVAAGYDTADSMINQADINMYDGKRARRNSVILADAIGNGPDNKKDGGLT